MFNNKKLPAKKVSLKKINFSSFKNSMNTKIDENLLPINHSPLSFNFNLKNGALTTGFGVSPLTLHYNENYADRIKTLVQPTGLFVDGAWVFNQYMAWLDKYEQVLVLYCSDKKMYYNVLNSNFTNFSQIPDLSFEEVPNVIYYKLDGVDSIILTSKTEGMYVWNSQIYRPKKIEDSPNIVSMCVHYERLFATVSGSRNEVWFSDDLDPTNWTVSLNEAGFIQMSDERGALNKVISFNDHVYVFREYGISRITAFGNQQDFSVAHLFFSNSKIFEKTVCACGDNVFFLAKDGVYVFNGVTAKKLSLNFDNLIEATQSATACFHNGKYYLATRMHFGDGVVEGSEQTDAPFIRSNNVLIELDVDTGEVNLHRGIRVLQMVSLSYMLYSRLLIIAHNWGNNVMGQLDESGKVHEYVTYKYWRSPQTDLGHSNRLKNVKELHVTNTLPFVLTVKSETATKEISVPASQGISRVRINMTGKLFTFIFTVRSQFAHIANAEVIFGVV